ncbi:MAG: MBL fold metallo-hydrolase [Deltaproteobacteria bacterium]|nr:MBL fold metallo-hydrolase [Deltaproteobacteria bacterium]
MHVTFAGAAGTVTGSRYLVRTRGANILVDCGLFQGIKSLRERNWSSPPFDPAALDAVVLTHAHIDHSGYLPRLVKNGFSGRIWCTRGTADLLRILLPDSGYLQEEEARFANKHGYARHHPALPLYTREEAESCLQHLEPREFYTPFSPAEGVNVRFSRAGHIVGSSYVALEADGSSICFSGDVGREVDPIMKAPDPLPACDYLVLESTYGDRRHPPEDVDAKLAALVRETVGKGGTLVVPAFAVGRAQHILHLLAELKRTEAIPNITVYLDSPMAIQATSVFARHVEDHKLTPEECVRLCALPRNTATSDESRAIDLDPTPKIVISASGMATGGRVLHHLRRFLPEAQHTVLLVGYQTAGTRGRTLLDGCDELKLLGQYVPVKAKIAYIEGLSAHADYVELLALLRRSKISPKRVFVTHGEPAPTDAMRRRLNDAFSWDTVVPEHGQTIKLG